MEVTIRLTKNDGEVVEITRALGTLSTTDIITSIEKELGELKEEMLPFLSEALLKEQQDLYSAEKENHNIQKKTVQKK